MTNRNIRLLLLLFVFTFTAGCGAVSTPTPTPAPTPTPLVTPQQIATPTPEPVPTPTPDPVAEQLAALTTAEKVGQLFIAGFEGTAPASDATAIIQEYKMGGVILFSRNVASAKQLVTLTNDLKALNGDALPLFVSVDQEGGMVERMPPELNELPHTIDVGDAGAAGRTVAAQCKAFGFNMDFAPSLDIWSNPENTVIGRRAFGTHWADVALKGPEAAYAMMAEGVIPVVKHFPGHGDTAIDSHMGLPSVTKTVQELRQNELVPFARAIGGTSPTGILSDPVPAVMVAHILMTNIDPEKPASLSPAVVTDLLRGELGFTGVVATDDLTMGAITNNYGLGEACVLAVEAGCDLLLVCHEAENVKASYEAVLHAATSGRITAQRLDESVSRILSLKNEYQLSGAPVPHADTDALNDLVAAVWAQ